jgi:uncharacterized protein YkwD
LRQAASFGVAGGWQKGTSSPTLSSPGATDTNNKSGEADSTSNAGKTGSAASGSGTAPGLSSDCPEGQLTAALVAQCATSVRRSPSPSGLPCSVPASVRPAGTLTVDPRLTAAAQKHADFLSAAASGPSSSGANGNTPLQRVTSEGFPVKKVAEVLASGRTSVRDVVYNWMCGQGERDQLMVSGACMLGAGHFAQVLRPCVKLRCRGP